MNFLRTVYRAYVTMKRVVIALAHICAGLAICAVALLLLGFGLSSNITEFPGASVAVIVVVIAVAGFGLARVCEALPGILPAKTSDAPGKSRLATRRDLRRSGII